MFEDVPQSFSFIITSAFRDKYELGSGDTFHAWGLGRTLERERECGDESFKLLATSS